jgi:hypothetical protein
MHVVLDKVLKFRYIKNFLQVVYNGFVNLFRLDCMPTWMKQHITNTVSACLVLCNHVHFDPTQIVCKGLLNASESLVNAQDT